jgi:peroxiredoxin
MVGRSRWAAVLLLLAVTAVMLGGCARKPATTGRAPAPPAAPTAAPAPVRVGGDAPNFTLETSNGKSITLADLKGKPVVLNFWASWCHFCAQEAPDLDALYQQYQSKGLQVLGVGTDEAAALKAKAKELGLTYPTGANAEAARTYGVGGVPHTFFVDREGKITASLLGARPKAELEAEVRKIL